MIKDNDLKYGQEVYNLLIGSKTAIAVSILNKNKIDNEVLLMANKELFKYFENEYINAENEEDTNKYLVCSWRCRIEIGKILNKEY